MYVSRGRGFCAEGTVRREALRQGCAWHVERKREEARVDGVAWVRGRTAGDEIRKALLAIIRTKQMNQ